MGGSVGVALGENWTLSPDIKVLYIKARLHERKRKMERLV